LVDVAVLVELLRAGADLELRCSSLYDCRALHLAALSGQATAVHAIVAHSANPDSQDADGLSPLQYAQDAGHTTIVSILEPVTRVGLSEVPVDKSRKQLSNGKLSMQMPAAKIKLSRQQTQATGLKGDGEEYLRRAVGTLKWIWKGRKGSLASVTTCPTCARTTRRRRTSRARTLSTRTPHGTRLALSNGGRPRRAETRGDGDAMVTCTAQRLR
jgi:hypothetical protein